MSDLSRGRETFRSGPYLPRRARKDAVRTLIVATEHDEPSLAALTESLLDTQLRQPYVKPVLLVGTVDTTPLAASGLLHETCFGPEELAVLQLDVSWPDYRRERIQTMVDVYAPHIVLELQAGETLTAQAVVGDDARGGGDNAGGGGGDAGGGGDERAVGGDASHTATRRST